MSTRSGRVRTSAVDTSPPKTRKGVSPPRSPARTRKTSPPARSPGRRSPARRSPGRPTKFPARKSPSRATKETTEKVPKSPAKRQPIKSNVDIKLMNVDNYIAEFKTLRTRRSDYTVKDISSGITQNELTIGDKVNGVDSLFSTGDLYGLKNRKPTDVPPRRSGRLKEFAEGLPDIRRSLSKSISESVSKSISTAATYSDSETSEVELRKDKSHSVTRKLATPLRNSVNKLVQQSGRWEFGGPIVSSALIILFPLTVFSILISCSKSCSISLDNIKQLTASSLFSKEAVVLVGSQWIIQAILACTPILGTKADRNDESGHKYCFNAFFASIFTVAVLFGLDFLKIVNCNVLLNEYLKLAATSFIFATVLSIALYAKSRKMDDSDLNPYGNTGYVLYDFWIGREIHPMLKKLDVKVWISRVSNINALILAILVFKHGFQLPAKTPENLTLETTKELLSTVKYTSEVILYSMMQIIYILMFVMKEYKITTTFFWQSEGVGYLQTVASGLYPFFFVTLSKFVADSAIPLSNNVLVASSVLYTLGALIMLVSNNIKHEFRVNPMHPNLNHLETMPTFHGKKLLVSNLWARLRHPNYAGDILIHTALALPGIISGQYVAASPALLTILVLIHRAWRDHSRCKRRYGAAWQRYCKRVPSALVPKVL